jgi:hypothetical protein
MKRLIAALFLIAAPTAMQAQVACTGSPCTAPAVNTSLTVKSAVSFTVNGAVDFGSVVGGTTAQVDAQGTSSSLGASGGVILNANQAVTVKATFSSLTSGSTSLPVTLPSCGWSTVGSTSTTNTTIFSCSAGYVSPAAGTGASGIYVWLGGEVATTASTPAGNYAGTATVTGTYTAY